MSNPRMMFVNLAVRDLGASKNFFNQLGFQFNQQFSDDKAACMVISEQAYVMLLTEPFFKTFTKNELCDTARSTEGLYALSCSSRAEVDDLLKKALDGGGRQAMETQDQGFMYSTSFYDLDNHHWELVWMDPKAMGGQG